MTRLGGAVGAAAAFALTAGLAFDGGGFAPLAYDRALVGVAALCVLLAILLPAERPGRFAAAQLAGLALLVAWTASSWLWSGSPPSALVEAQRVALYLAAAAAVALAGRRVPAGAVAAGVAAGAALPALWNVALRLAPDWTGRPRLVSDIGSLADPVGYANGLALLAVLAMLLVLGLRPPAAALLVPLAACVALMQSTGALAALAAGAGAYAVAARRPLRVLALAVLPAAAAVAVAREPVVVDPPTTNALAAAHAGHRLLLVLALLMLAQAAVAFAPLPAGPRIPLRFAAVAAAAGLAVAALALHGHERGAYWSVAAHELRANAVLGSGAGTFVGWWLRLRTAPLSTQEAHSLYLETAAELGPLGLALLLVALAAALAAAWRARMPTLLAALVAWDVAAAVDFHWELAGVTVPAILLGAAAAVHASPPAGGLPRRYVLPPLAALTAAAVLALAGTAPLAAAQDALRRGDRAAAAADARRALRFAPFSADAWRVVGEAEQGGAARAAFRRALELDPRDWSLWASLAAVSKGEPRRLARAEAARLNPLGGSR